MLAVIVSLPCVAMSQTTDNNATPPATANAPAPDQALPKSAGAASDQAAPKPANAATDLSKPVIVEQKTDHKFTTFTIRLAANATTGFQWFLTGYDPDIMKPLRSSYVTNPGKLMGSPGISEWEFQLKPVAFSVPQVTHIQFEYRRPWEANFSSRQSITVITQPASDSTHKTEKPQP